MNSQLGLDNAPVNKIQGFAPNPDGSVDPNDVEKEHEKPGKVDLNKVIATIAEYDIAQE